MSRAFLSAGVTCCVLWLGGCVVGQSLPAGYQATPAAPIGEGTYLSVEVHDERPYVLSGDKPPYFIGKYRAGFGNPWDVTTEGQQPLAGVIERDLSADLRALGYSVVSTAEAQRRLDVAIMDWNFDAMINGKFWYEFRLRVLDAAGTLLTEDTVTDASFIEGSFWTGAKGAFEKQMPDLYAGAIRKIARENAGIIAALDARSP
jgi:hypothetical protein